MQCKFPGSPVSLHCILQTIVPLLHKHTAVSSGWAEKNSRWSRSRCRAFVVPRAGPGPPGCQTHYCLWSWRWPCLPDLRQGEQHCQGLYTVRRQVSSDKHYSAVDNHSISSPHFCFVSIGANIDFIILRLDVAQCISLCVCVCVSVCVCTLPRHYNTSHAIWDAGACCQEGDAHDDIGYAESEADHSHLKPSRCHLIMLPILYSLSVH